MLRSKPLCHKSRLTTFNSTQTGWKQAKNINILGKVSAAQKKNSSHHGCAETQSGSRQKTYLYDASPLIRCMPRCLHRRVNWRKLARFLTAATTTSTTPPRVRSTDRFPEAAKPLGVTRPKKYNSPSPKKSGTPSRGPPTVAEGRGSKCRTKYIFAHCRSLFSAAEAVPSTHYWSVELREGGMM